MDEKFLHYLWKFRLLHSQLRLVSGEALTVLHPGDHNHDGGPDFFNARIRLGSTTWAGNVEIHGKSSDWFRHGHQLDKAYESVILHVVFEHDREVMASGNRIIPTLEVKNQYPETMLHHYRCLMSGNYWIPCHALLNSLDRREFSPWMTVLAIERLQKKAKEISLLWNSCAQDWEESFYRFMSLNFGFRINSLPFELLAKALPWKFLSRQRNDLFRIEALLFGMSGLISSGSKDCYPLSLYAEFEFLRDKYQLRPVHPGLWKFLRLRPSNFPTIRLSQWAAFLNGNQSSLFEMLNVSDLSAWYEKLGVSASAYWDDHFIFDKISVSKPKIMGKSSIDLLIINALVPYLFFYSRQKALPAMAAKAISILEQLPAENNSLMKLWEKEGMPVKSALCTQALIHLKHDYCDVKRCLECRIGLKILKTESHEITNIDQGLPVV